LSATILGHLIRCLFLRDGERSARGTCKASWIAETFAVNVRSVKAARKELSRMGWLKVTESHHWHRQRFGGMAVVNLGWADSVKARKRSGFSPRSELSTTGFSPPDIKQETPTESRYQKLKRPERSGVKGEAKP